MILVLLGEFWTHLQTPLSPLKDSKVWRIVGTQSHLKVFSPHPLWHETSVYNVISQGPVTPVTWLLVVRTCHNQYLRFLACLPWPDIEPRSLGFEFESKDFRFWANASTAAYNQGGSSDQKLRSIDRIISVNDLQVWCI